MGVAAVTSGSTDKTGPAAREKGSPIAKELHCKRCGEAMTTLGAILGNLGDEPRSKLFRCLACGLYDWMKA
jgi:DNA-directed RNA polymerase subunit M/transcription elongation factor TFIIS